MSIRTTTTLCLFAGLTLSACHGSADYAAEGANIGQGGAQDFGAFRQILEEGGVPGPSTIDDVGFFAEHYIELPDPDCGQDVCVHGLLGMMGNMIDGSDCTVVLVGMNTPIDVSEYERPPLNLALAIDTSGSMEGSAMEWVRIGLNNMVDSLQPEDRISIVDFDSKATVIIENAHYEDVDAWGAIETLQANGGTNIYDGLETAFELVDTYAEEFAQNRVILLSDGLATAGNTDSGDILDMAEGWADQGYGLTTIGMGDSFDVDLMRSLSEVGKGSFYFLEDGAAVQEVFVDEVETFLVPIGEDADISLDISDGYDLRGLFGTTDFELEGNHAGMEIDILQLASRTSDSTEGGRRGGGMSVLAEMLPVDTASAGEVGTLSFTYTEVSSGEQQSQEVQVITPTAPVDIPVEGEFLHPSVEKAFVMLNVYVAFEMAATSALEGDDRQAIATLMSLCANVEAWLVENPDQDIADDLVYIKLFIDNLQARQPQGWEGGWGEPGDVCWLCWVFD